MEDRRRFLQNRQKKRGSDADGADVDARHPDSGQRLSAFKAWPRWANAWLGIKAAFRQRAELPRPPVHPGEEEEEEEEAANLPA